MSAARTALALTLAVALLPLACVQVRLLTYPSEFVWLGDEDVRGVMHVMAARMARLEGLLGDGGGEAGVDETRRRGDVDAELGALEELAAAIAAGAAIESGERALPRTNHLLIDEHIDEFVADIARARRFVAEEPPNYYPAGQLSGSCNACHRRRETEA